MVAIPIKVGMSDEMLKWKKTNHQETSSMCSANQRSSISYEMERKGWWLGRHPKCDFWNWRTWMIRRRMFKQVMSSKTKHLHYTRQHDYVFCLIPSIIKWLTFIETNSLDTLEMQINDRKRILMCLKKRQIISMAKCVTARWSFIYR